MTGLFEPLSADVAAKWFLSRMLAHMNLTTEHNSHVTNKASMHRGLRPQYPLLDGLIQTTVVCHSKGPP